MLQIPQFIMWNELHSFLHAPVIQVMKPVKAVAAAEFAPMSWEETFLTLPSSHRHWQLSTPCSYPPGEIWTLCCCTSIYPPPCCRLIESDCRWDCDSPQRGQSESVELTGGWVSGGGAKQGCPRGEAGKPQRFHADVAVPRSPRSLSEMHPEGQTQIALEEVQESALWARHFH